MSGEYTNVEPGMMVCDFVGKNMTVVGGAATSKLDIADLSNSLTASGGNLKEPEDLSGKFACQAIPNQPPKPEAVPVAFAPAKAMSLTVEAR